MRKCEARDSSSFTYDNSVFMLVVRTPMNGENTAPAMPVESFKGFFPGARGRAELDVEVASADWSITNFR